MGVFVCNPSKESKEKAQPLTSWMKEHPCRGSNAEAALQQPKRKSILGVRASSKTPLLGNWEVMSTPGAAEQRNLMDILETLHPVASI